MEWQDANSITVTGAAGDVVRFIIVPMVTGD